MDTEGGSGQSGSSFAAESAPDPHGDEAYFTLECRPSTLIAARYTDLPFPSMGPVQDVAFDLGITAFNGTVEVNGIVIKGYSGHQMLFEQRWPASTIRQRTGEADLRIQPGAGLAVRSMQFLLPGYESLSGIEVTVIGRTAETDAAVGDANAAMADPGEHTAHESATRRLQAVMQVPVQYHEQQTDIHFPLRGVWWAVQAGDWSDQHKLEVFSQPYAVDFVKLGANNRFFAGRGLELTDHYSWDEPVYATAGGKVAYVCYDMPDLLPGAPPDPRMFRQDPRRILGNAVAISHGNGEFSYFAHLQQASLQVNQGQMVKRGQLLGRVGNSGRSPGPHLHFHLMAGPNLFIDQGLPVRFTHFEAGGQFFTEPTFIPTRMIVSSERTQTGKTDD